jgi:predicted ArsR family transcriptional regulator
VRREFERDVIGIGALAEPVRRALYLYVCAQDVPVSRDQAAAEVGVTRHQAKFHLDRLEAEGLLEADFARLTGRTGPGAGRTSKRYRRASREVTVSLPDREYELAGQLMADAITESTRRGTPVDDALQDAATAHGRSIGTNAVAGVRPRTQGAAVSLVMRTLGECGYEPRYDGSRVVMANCPFHRLARTHTALVCHMNLALVTGLVDAIAPRLLGVNLDPGEKRCCVTVEQRDAPDDTAGSDLVAVLQRWEESGATWRVLVRRRGQVTVALCRCDDGEEVDRFTTADPELTAFLAGRSSSTG